MEKELAVMSVNETSWTIIGRGIRKRLRPITDEVPKCLVEVGGEPILGWWLKHLESIECEAVIINTHYKAEKVSKYIKERGSLSMDIHEKYEPKLLGTAGSIVANKKFFTKSTIIVAHVDNATDIDLGKLIEAHKRATSAMLTHYVNLYKY